jgi:hypothetical protein
LKDSGFDLIFATGILMKLPITEPKRIRITAAGPKPSLARALPIIPRKISGRMKISARIKNIRSIIENGLKKYLCMPDEKLDFKIYNIHEDRHPEKD